MFWRPLGAETAGKLALVARQYPPKKNLAPHSVKISLAHTGQLIDKNKKSIEQNERYEGLGVRSCRYVLSLSLPLSLSFVTKEIKGIIIEGATREPPFLGGDSANAARCGNQKIIAKIQIIINLFMHEISRIFV